MADSNSIEGLACCHGYRVASGDVVIGEVETPIFAGLLLQPEFLLVRTGALLSGTFRVIPASLVVDVDRARRRVAVAADGNRLAALPEHLPVRRGARAGRAA